ncbi:hypothetical protein T02_15712 [Trichinella nativa]|uniref:Uncharacterized protein n=1 Tax=Trichinella nativa TaxID=6335 RepID=A0A0V1LL14_9BILA|nr:hypothetical protein T02_15712 [Trichinella nativa]
MDRRSSLSLPQSASEYMVSAFSVLRTFCVLQIAEDAFNGSPVCLPRIIRKTTDNPHCVANVWPTTLT